MASILVCGLINIETTLKVDGFPVDYAPARYPFFGIHTTVSGVGYNVALALHTLGDQVDFLSLVGRDLAGKLVLESLQSAGIPSQHVLRRLPFTPQSVILYDPQGRRSINTDLKDVQSQSYPSEAFEKALSRCSLAVLANVNFSRPFLEAARRAGKMVATDVHAIASIDDEYNRNYMAAADILFQSDENLPVSPEAWIRQLWDRYENEIVVVGLGSQGALLGVRSDSFLERVSAVYTRPVVNTIGAGDALFSSFVHFYHITGDPYVAIRKAVLFASYKIGERGAADGFLTEQGLEELESRLGTG